MNPLDRLLSLPCKTRHSFMEHSKLNFPFDIAKFFDDFMQQNRRKINQRV